MSNYKYQDQTKMPSYAKRLQRSKIEMRVLKQLREEHSGLYKRIRAGVIKEFDVERQQEGEVS